MIVDNDTHKNLCFGSSKTTTVDTCDVLEILGLKSVCHIKLQEFDHCNPVNDSLVNAIYKILYQQHQSSKLIVVICELDRWIRNCQEYFKERDIRVKTRQGLHRDYSFLTHCQLRGTLLFNLEKMLNRFYRYYHDVYTYFADRLDDLLGIDITKSSEWRIIHALLNVSTRNCGFPKSNTAEQAESHLDWSISFMDKAQRASRQVQVLLRLTRKLQEFQISKSYQKVINRGALELIFNMNSSSQRNFNLSFLAH